MRLVSVNVGMPIEVPGSADGTVKTGIFKMPVAGPAMVHALNVDGDGQGDLVHHGGPDQAVYAYALEDYDYWTSELGRNYPTFCFPNYGWFGENLTIAGGSSDAVCIGDVLQVGEAVLQVTDPRVPCSKLERKMGVADFAAAFRRSGRVGFYLRVLEEGLVQAGNDVTTVRRDSNAVSVSRMSAIHHARHVSVEELDQALRIEGLSAERRRLLDKRRAKALAARHLP